MQRVAYLIVLIISCGFDGDRASAAPTSQATPPVRFLTSEHLDLWPCFSPDGTQVLFTRSDGPNAVFWVVSVAGGQPRPFGASPIPVAATRANWSRQTNRIAFTGVSTDHNDVWLVNADGSNAHPVTIAGLSKQVFYPSWYPDGNTLAVMDAQELVIRKIDLTAGLARPATRPAQVMTGMPSVSPDGKWIAFAGQENRGQPYDQTKNSIWLVDDTAIARPLESTLAQGRAPTWSPDGQRLSFESNRDSALGLYAIFLINKDGTGLIQITDSSLNADHPVWSPDGQRLAISARSSWWRKERGIAIIDLPSAPSPTDRSSGIRQ